MVCPACSYENPENSAVCAKCTTPLPLNDQTLATGGQGWSVPVADGVVSNTALIQLSPGTSIGSRYEVVRLLGQGGMGAVYQAHDKELDRQVAIKVIRADMAANPEILRRFKQELILARQITHKNVIRIFDLGQADGIKFITMEYIEGENLQSVLRRKKKLEPAEAANILAQVCRALDAAHNEGVIHRDLKPQNIMLDQTGRAYVMDFGIARSMLGAGMTKTGALIGTPDYMSPEQAKGQALDARSDLFSAGIILYEMLSGQVPFDADTTMGKLWKRTNEPARPLDELDKTIPQPLSDIVRKCLEIDSQKRFASAAELLQRIEMWQGPAAGTRVVAPVATGLPAYIKWAAVALGFLGIVAAFLLRAKMTSHPAGSHAPVTVLIADFDNKTGNSVFDGTLEPTLGLALEGAPFVSLYDRGQARRIATQVQPGSLALTDEVGRLVAIREGISVVVGGSVTREDNLYRVSVQALDAVTGKSVARSSTKVAKKDILIRMGVLAADIRKSLGDTTPESTQLTAAETFTTGSLEAAHEYGLCQTAQLAGKWNEAIQHCLAAAQLDPNLGRAYAILGAIYHNMGQVQQSQKYYQLALTKIDRMSEREKYRTRGAYYLMIRDSDKAIEEQTQLVKLFPADNAGIANLALAYFYSRDMQRALQEGRRAAEMNSGNAVQRANVGLYAMYASDFDTAISTEREVLKQYPALDYAYIGTALSQLASGGPKAATDTYTSLEKLGPGGSSVASAGLADIALYEGRASDAVGILDKGAKDDSANKNADGAANKLATLSEARLLTGDQKQAVADAQSGLALSKEIDVMFFAARTYIAGNQEQKALALAQQLESRLQPDARAYGKLLEGEIALKHKKVQEALNLFLDSRKIADTWMSRFDAARAYVDAGGFAQAYSELELCLKRRGEATALFLDEFPTYHLFPPVYYYLGRAQEGLQSPAASDSYKAFLAIRSGSPADPLVVDARHRLSAN